jgi:hypothetical protein
MRQKIRVAMFLATLAAVIYMIVATHPALI